MKMRHKHRRFPVTPQFTAKDISLVTHFCVGMYRPACSMQEVGQGKPRQGALMSCCMLAVLPRDLLTWFTRHLQLLSCCVLSHSCDPRLTEGLPLYLGAVSSLRTYCVYQLWAKSRCLDGCFSQRWLCVSWDALKNSKRFVNINQLWIKYIMKEWFVLNSFCHLEETLFSGSVSN